MTVIDSQFADYVALYATCRDSFESVAAEFVKVAREWGLTVSTEKTKGLVVGEGLLRVMSDQCRWRVALWM